MEREEILQRFAELRESLRSRSPELAMEISDLESRFASNNIENDAWQRVQIARTGDRPGTLDYIAKISESYMELHGDRTYGDDKAIVGGIAVIDGVPMTFIGHQKGRNLRENMQRHYGMGSPEGYRKALRLAKQAEAHGRPVITFIDTSGAYPGLESEERGIGEAIAVNLREFSVLRAPIINFVIGEGGSGGALGIGVGDKLYMLENAVYSVISPEGFASILLRDSTKAEYAASLMKMTAKDIADFGIVHGIIPEVAGGAHLDPDYTAREIKKVIIRDYGALQSNDYEKLVRYRSRKLRDMGRFSEKSTREDLFGLFSRIPWLKNRNT
ncbi:acetyl-CoA carboxylase carboxyltransferase subunit alpha [Candidatus Haliotispira prima]|uniref:Acetyl-coenzyme A carboxylase carboxyl transferase subunit alpha n=1 Tax=Candidatus Haliotispira prima TaxID=3034016 RepID=A0ABY8MIA6_9SPIO|nr:acetyl-CoA carboxylase carboxyltransferase subunit alpha [Candidatus Haliotispira prima]